MLRRLVPPIAFALFLAACGGGGGGASEPIAALNGDWTLTSGTGPGGDVEVGDGVEVTLTIDEGGWGGTVCNHYGADSVEVGDGTVTIDEVYSTDMACLDDRIMRAEVTYLEALTAVSAYEVTEDELRLTGEGVELVYTPVATEPEPDLVGTRWVLEALLEGAGPDGTARSTVAEATLELLEDGTFVASSGCLDRDDGRYEVDGSRLITQFAFDYDYDCDVAAEDGGFVEDAWEQDRQVWEVLGGDPELTIEDQRLTLTTDELGLVYRAATATDDD